MNGIVRCHLYISMYMFSPTTPRAYALYLIDGMAFSTSPPRQSQMDEWLRSLTPISTSMFNIVRPQILPEYDLLIFGRILNTSQPSQNETDWTVDSYNGVLVIHMLQTRNNGIRTELTRLWIFLWMSLNPVKVNFEKTNFMIGTKFYTLYFVFKVNILWFTIK